MQDSLALAAETARLAYAQWRVRKLLPKLALAVFFMLVAVMMTGVLLLAGLAGLYAMWLHNGMEPYRAMLLTAAVAALIAAVLVIAAWLSLKRPKPTIQRGTTRANDVIDAFFDGLFGPASWK